MISTPLFGVNINGNEDKESLIPRGWQRARTLASLFDPVDGNFRNGLKIIA